MTVFAFVPCASGVFHVRAPLGNAQLAQSRSRSRTGFGNVRMDSGETQQETKKQIRKRIIKLEKFRRSGYREVKKEASNFMRENYQAETMTEFRTNDFELKRDQISWHLAKAYGFCWGVERSLALAFEAINKYPDRKKYLTNEIIHNPIVNEQMSKGGVEFVPENGLEKDYSKVTKDDIVLLPAFGAKLEDMQYLTENSYEIVDTTCPWVSRVWNQIDDHHAKNVTSIVHGKYQHEETIATVSFGTRYLVVKNMDQAEYVCDYIVNGGDKQVFLDKFKGAYSEGFDPDTDLKAIGVANQTTMLKSETMAIAKLFERTMMRIHDPETFQKSFVGSDTICNATQERQDAVIDLLGEKKLDLMLVVGGFNSSNTSHLQELAEHAGVTSYWVDRPDRINFEKNTIWARTAEGKERLVEDFLPNRPLSIGLTSGASTPDQNVEKCMARINEAHARVMGKAHASH